MSVETAIVPVAGLGTRLIPISSAVPKELLPLGRKPALQYIVEELGQAGIKRIVLVTSEAKRSIGFLFERDLQLESRLREAGKHEILQQLWSQSPYSQIQIDIAIQKQQRGLGHAVLCGEAFVNNRPLVVALGDSLIGLGGHGTLLTRMLNEFETRKADIVIAFDEVPDDQVNRFGIACPISDTNVFELSDLIEKPDLGTAPSNLAVAARYIFAPQIFEALKQTPPGKDNEIQLTDAIHRLIADGAKAIGVRLEKHERRFDVGDLQSYVRTFIEFALYDPQLRDEVLAAIENYRPPVKPL